jgi:hypothetical protein
VRATQHTGARRRIARILAAAVLGTLAMLPVAAPAHASISPCATEDVWVGGHQLPVGKYICAWGWTEIGYNGGDHVFVVGTTYNVYHTWTRADGSWTSWENLGGSARSEVYAASMNDGSRRWLTLTVFDINNRPYCKIHNGYNRPGGWWPSLTTWSSANNCR